MGEIETLVDFVKAGDLGKVRSVLEDNFLLASQRLPNGETPLMAALYRGHGDIVDALINAVAYDGWTPLHLAAFFGHAENVCLLLDAGADVHAVSHNGLKNTPLHAAT